jgi:N-acetyl-1-D-myo-inositol-2-amino-2-deoxy-alpha-D-glucopyranoside deacetylase
MADPERVLFVHAHPDDETIETGGTIATLIDRGAVVTVLTCTRGERGEVVAPDLEATLGSPAALATHRVAELTKAMTILGVTDHRFLGDENARWSGQNTRTYRDSGMRWGVAGAEGTGETDLTSLDGAEFGDVAADIAAVIVDVRPDVVVSYDKRGGYGHPDHIRAGLASLRAAETYGVPFYAIDPTGEVLVDVSPVLDRKRAALGAYRSQLALEGDTMVYPGGQRRPVEAVEGYSQVVATGEEPIPFSAQHPAARFVSAVLGGVVGAALGALLTVYNQFTGKIAGHEIWVGAVAATAIVAAILIGFRLAFGTRVVAAFAAAGVIVAVAVFALPSSKGTPLIVSSGPGLLWQIAPVVLTVVVLAWPQGRRRRPSKIDEQPVKGPQRS